MSVDGGRFRVRIEQVGSGFGAWFGGSKWRWSVYDREYRTSVSSGFTITESGADRSARRAIKNCLLAEARMNDVRTYVTDGEEAA